MKTRYDIELEIKDALIKKTKKFCLLYQEKILIVSDNAENIYKSIIPFIYKNNVHLLVYDKKYYNLYNILSDPLPQGVFDVCSKLIHYSTDSPISFNSLLNMSNHYLVLYDLTPVIYFPLIITERDKYLLEKGEKFIYNSKIKTKNKILKEYDKYKLMVKKNISFEEFCELKRYLDLNSYMKKHKLTINNFSLDKGYYYFIWSEHTPIEKALLNYIEET